MVSVLSRSRYRNFKNHRSPLAANLLGPAAPAEISPLRGSLRLQALHRSVPCGEGSLHRRPVSQSTRLPGVNYVRARLPNCRRATRERSRALRRREDADSCSGNDAAAAAHGIWLRGRQG